MIGIKSTVFLCAFITLASCLTKDGITKPLLVSPIGEDTICVTFLTPPGSEFSSKDLSCGEKHGGRMAIVQSKKETADVNEFLKNTVSSVITPRKDYFCITVVTSSRVTWSEAESSCRNTYGGRLIVLDTKEKDDLVGKYVKRLAINHFLWIGGSTPDRDVPDESRTFFWIDGMPFNYTNWAPDNSDNFKNKENCVCLWPAKDYQWNDFYCEDKFYYICENF